MFNKAIVVGRLTTDPEVKVTQGKGTSVCSFTLAIDRPFKGQDGEKLTDFLDVVAWRSTAEFIGKFFGKGDLLGVEGSVQKRSYTNKDGDKRHVVEIVADRAFFVGGKEKNTVQTENAVQPEITPEEYEAINGYSDLPF